jgi:RimJ/RimL family protein N-acetyltransferase
VIYGESTRLRAVEREDLSRFVIWLNDPEVLAGLSLFLPLSMGEEEQWFQNMLKAPASEHPLVIEISEGDEWVPVGNCGFHQIEWKNRSGELGIFIGEKRYWNKGYGTEVMKLLLRHGFNTLNLHRIFLRVFSNNLRAVRSYEKAGFVHEGCMRLAEYRDGRYVDVLLMSVLRSEWKE